MNKNLYENYHKQSKSQNKIIDKNNFTYINILPILNNYLTEKTKNVLDIGCGAGTISFYIAKKGIAVKGIDISKKAIQVCKNSAEGLNISNASFEICNFPKKIPSGKYDLVFFSEVIEHLENDEIALRKIKNLLNSAGILFISTPSKNAPLYKIGYAARFDREVGHLRRYTITELETKLRRNGFKIKKSYKKESILRNFFFLNSIAGNGIKIINKLHLAKFFTYIDNYLSILTGESQIIIIAQKKS